MAFIWILLVIAGWIVMGAITSFVWKLFKADEFKAYDEIDIRLIFWAWPAGVYLLILYGVIVIIQLIVEIAFIASHWLFTSLPLYVSGLAEKIKPNHE